MGWRLTQQCNGQEEPNITSCSHAVRWVVKVFKLASPLLSSTSVATALPHNHTYFFTTCLTCTVVEMVKCCYNSRIAQVRLLRRRHMHIPWFQQLSSCSPPNVLEWESPTVWTPCTVGWAEWQWQGWWSSSEREPPHRSAAAQSHQW